MYTIQSISACALDESPDLLVSKVSFVDGPGGTGKTFLFNALLDAVRRKIRSPLQLPPAAQQHCYSKVVEQLILHSKYLWTPPPSQCVI